MSPKMVVHRIQPGGDPPEVVHLQPEAMRQGVFGVQGSGPDTSPGRIE